jgi:hypothetical protein
MKTISFAVLYNCEIKLLNLLKKDLLKFHTS